MAPGPAVGTGVRARPGAQNLEPVPSSNHVVSMCAAIRDLVDSEINC